MNLEDLREEAQKAFVSKKIHYDYVKEFSPERVLNMLAVLQACKEMRDDIINRIMEDNNLANASFVDSHLRPTERLFTEAVTHLESMLTGRKSKVISINRKKDT